MSRSLVFVDSSAWVALYDPTDQHHAEARKHWDVLRDDRRLLLTSDYVLDETYTLVRRRRGGLDAAVALRNRIAGSQLVRVENVGPEGFAQAWELFIRYHDTPMSFTDCTSFALMRRLDLYEAFAFDQDFHRAGFVARP